MKTLFLDTAFIIALESLGDQYHQLAINYWNTLLNDPTKIVTTSYVFNEVITFFNCRGFHQKAIEIGENILNSNYIRFVKVDDYLFQNGWEYFKTHEDKDYSLTDCVSFVVMEQLKINIALTFDRHFIQAGFIVLP